MAILTTTTPPNYSTLSFFYKQSLNFSKPLSSLFFPTQKPAKPITLTKPFSSQTDPPPEPIKTTDERGERTDPESKYPNAPNVDPPKNEDEGKEEKDEIGNDVSLKSKEVVFGDKVGKLKRGLVDSVSGSGFGFQASVGVRGEVLELVVQLEALNPTSKPVESSGLLDGNWILV